jgi:hypothetical protein
MRTTWLSIAACGALFFWAAEVPRLSAPGKPPPPQCPPYCQQPVEDAGDQDSASDADGASAVDSGGDGGGGRPAPDSGGGSGGGGPAVDSGGDSGDGAAVDSGNGGSSLVAGGCGCDLVGQRPNPAAGVAGLAFAALIALRRRGRVLMHRWNEGIPGPLTGRRGWHSTVKRTRRCVVKRTAGR